MILGLLLGASVGALLGHPRAVAWCNSETAAGSWAVSGCSSGAVSGCVAWIVLAVVRML